MTPQGEIKISINSRKLFAVLLVGVCALVVIATVLLMQSLNSVDLPNVPVSEALKDEVGRAYTNQGMNDNWIPSDPAQTKFVRGKGNTVELIGDFWFERDGLGKKHVSISARKLSDGSYVFGETIRDVPKE